MLKKRRSVYVILLSIYSLFLLNWMFFSFGRSDTSNYSYRMNLIPFQTITQMFINFKYYPLATWLINFFGNIIVFIPYGFILPLLQRTRWYSFLFISLILLAGIEMLQFLFHRGVLDVDDIILNLLGIGLGYGLAYLVKNARKDTK